LQKNILQKNCFLKFYDYFFKINLIFIKNLFVFVSASIFTYRQSAAVVLVLFFNKINWLVPNRLLRHTTHYSRARNLYIIIPRSKVCDRRIEVRKRDKHCSGIEVWGLRLLPPQAPKRQAYRLQALTEAFLCS
jgi:hypothetical protein